MTHDPTRRTNRQREQRRAERQHERHIAKATLAAAVRALGAGEADDWMTVAQTAFRLSAAKKRGCRAMSEREEWPAWARQDEAPIAVMDEYTMWRRPDEKEFVTALYADGTVLRHAAYRSIECQTLEYVRQVIAFLDFPSSDYDRFAWQMALERANARRSTLPAPSRQKEDA